MIEMIAGAARELKLGDPRDPAVHIGPVIDAEAKDRLDGHIAQNEARGEGALLRAARRPAAPSSRRRSSSWSDCSDLAEEIFGPVLHVVRWKADELDGLLDAIEASGYGLTLGVHSRIDTTVERVVSRLDVGNCYVNRNMIGAVVGTQPFGGSGLSGTGPKAGGPNYLQALRHRADGHHQHGGGGRQRQPHRHGRMTASRTGAAGRSQERLGW